MFCKVLYKDDYLTVVCFGEGFRIDYDATVDYHAHSEFLGKTLEEAIESLESIGHAEIASMFREGKTCIHGQHRDL